MNLCNIDGYQLATDNKKRFKRWGCVWQSINFYVVNDVVLNHDNSLFIKVENGKKITLCGGNI